VKLARLRRPKIICSSSYAEFRPKKIAITVIGQGSHARRGMHTEEIGKGKET
jgi:hypothetical protein